jgi:hypothetical protein
MNHGVVQGVLGSQGGVVGAQWESKEGLGDVVVLRARGSGLGRFWGMWGPWRGNGWLVRIVGRVRGVQEVPWSARDRG